MTREQAMWSGTLIKSLDLLRERLGDQRYRLFTQTNRIVESSRLWPDVLYRLSPDQPVQVIRNGQVVASLCAVARAGEPEADRLMTILDLIQSDERRLWEMGNLVGPPMGPPGPIPSESPSSSAMPAAEVSDVFSVDAAGAIHTHENIPHIPPGWFGTRRRAWGLIAALALVWTGLSFALPLAWSLIGMWATCSFLVIAAIRGEIEERLDRSGWVALVLFTSLSPLFLPLLAQATDGFSSGFRWH